MAKADKRFIVSSRESEFTSGSKIVLIDKETGVNYLFVASGYAGGLTVMVDKDGKPIVTPINPAEY